MAISTGPPDEQVVLSNIKSNSTTTANDNAEWLHLPQHRIVTVEHPCIVNDVDKALASLGGENQIKNLLAPLGQTIPVSLSLRPHDPLAKKIVSQELQVSDFLLRVTLPRRTGRKRKRGSDEPFTHHPMPESTTHGQPLESSDILQRLRDNVDRYTVYPMGPINEAHRFRSLPDFQVKTGSQSVMREVAKHLLHASISDVKKFHVDLTPGVKPGEQILPPPNFTSVSQSFTYGYKQNSGVTTATDAQGRVTAMNVHKHRKRAILAVNIDIEQVPQGPPPDLVPLDQTSPYLVQAVKNLNDLLAQRPIVTRRAAMNLIDWGSETLFKDATQYVGFSFKSGPWRDALIKWGVDPRQDPQYRIYQTLSFMTKDKMVAPTTTMPGGRNTWFRTERYKMDDEPSHIFDGTGITTNGKTWQMCDITEPLLKRILDTTDLRSEADVENSGWYHNGTYSKARIIMRDMIGMMLSGQQPDLMAYEIVSSIPNIVDVKTYQGCYFDKEEHGDKVVKLSGDIRIAAKMALAVSARTRAVAARAMESGAAGRDQRVTQVAREGSDGATEDAEAEVEAEAESEVEGDDLDASDEEEALADEEE